LSLAWGRSARHSTSRTSAGRARTLGGADLAFGRAYREKIEKLAIVGDKRWQHVLASLAHPFYARGARFFHPTERAAAWGWLRAE
jgi:SpoIIAA-like